MPVNLRTCLDRLEDIYQRLETAALSSDRPDAAEIVFLRRQFAKAYLDFLDALDGDPLIAAHPRVSDQLKETLGTMRIRLMSYTLEWQPAQIEEDEQGYRAAARRIEEMVGRFIRETRAALDGIEGA